MECVCQPCLIFNLIRLIERRSLGFCTWVDQLKRGQAAGEAAARWGSSAPSGEVHLCCDRVKRVRACVRAMETGSAEPRQGALCFPLPCACVA